MFVKAELGVVHTEGNEDGVAQGVWGHDDNERGQGGVIDWLQQANSLLVKDFQQ